MVNLSSQSYGSVRSGEQLGLVIPLALHVNIVLKPFNLKAHCIHSTFTPALSTLETIKDV